LLQGFAQSEADAAHVKHIVKEFDTDGSGTINLSEFRRLYETLIVHSQQSGMAQLAGE